ncbi:MULTISPECIES: acetylglutamate kinase [Bacillaceae]|uniref:Acetylglutamate kinase n=1 Tax=Evansella alkalicola TaxID=745819 RepID=A0ABS6JWR4_9BACI|nr:MULTISPECIES: acetylglutamate kinase [Bacillaceae]MBU9723028.1 acetylglutamate kinase [Bacillus alkalicola]
MDYLVVKCGGSVLDNLPSSFYKNLVKLQQEGKCQPIIVHGGGPLISSLLTKLGVKTSFVNGLRVTTEDVLQVVEMVLSGSVNKQIVGKLQKVGGDAYGISGVDGKLLLAEQNGNESLGYVGDVVQVNAQMIHSIIDEGHIPVISPVGIGHDGQKYNINGDIAAAAVAKALNGKLCFVSDIPGIYVKDDHEDMKTCHQLTKKEAMKLIQDEVITGGMIPKVTAAIDSLEHDVEQVVILNGMTKDSLLDYVSGKEIGTKFVRDGEMQYASY